MLRSKQLQAGVVVTGDRGQRLVQFVREARSDLAYRQ